MFLWAAKRRHKVFYIIKKEWESKFIIGRLLRWTGAIFIDRDAPLSAMKTIIREMRKHDRFMVLIAPSGTRQYSEGWKPGFYYIAQKTKMPIMPAGPDYGMKAARVGTMLYPTGDIEADIETMRPFFESVTPKHPERATPIRLVPENNKEPAVIA